MRRVVSALKTLPSEDLHHSFNQLSESVWLQLAGKRIFITGGTGFVGKWLLATLIDVNDRLCLNCKITVLSRDPLSFKKILPELSRRVSWVTGDVRDFLTPYEHFDVVIHAATDVIAESTPEDIFTTCIDGTRRVVELCRKCSIHHHVDLLLVSSGAIYGQFPFGMTHVPESFLGAPDTLKASSAYAEGKRASELMVCLAAGENLFVKIARVFALVGPYLPLDKHFAIGNFLRAAIANKDIVVQGDGTPHRSYLYGADMAACLWGIVLKGQSGLAYNVGSAEHLSIEQLAHLVNKIVGGNGKIILLKKPQSNQPVQYYIPNIQRLQTDIIKSPPLVLYEAIARTASYLRQSGMII
jgi:nucleoside-diphosphate-sugar epimerase